MIPATNDRFFINAYPPYILIAHYPLPTSESFRGPVMEEEIFYPTPLRPVLDQPSFERNPFPWASWGPGGTN
eukprot:760437-Hanusia_phi.AAC.3